MRKTLAGVYFFYYSANISQSKEIFQQALSFENDFHFCVT